MGRRRQARTRAERPPGSAEPAERAWAGGLRGGPADTPASAAGRGARLALVVARNAVGVVGLLFFGWSPASLAVLYFVDTLAGMGAAFAAVGFKLSNVDPRRGFWTLVEGGFSGIAVATVLVAVVAVPLGIPLVFVLGSSRAVWREVWADPTVASGIGVVLLTGLVTAVQHVVALAEGRAGEATVKQAFTILVTRWVLVLSRSTPSACRSAASASTWSWSRTPSPARGASSPPDASPASSPTGARPGRDSRPARPGAETRGASVSTRDRTRAGP